LARLLKTLKNCALRTKWWYSDKLVCNPGGGRIAALLGGRTDAIVETAIAEYRILF
jgi:hypothetical protein